MARIRPEADRSEGALMGLRDSFLNLISLGAYEPAAVETRSVDPWLPAPDLATQLAALHNQPRPWRLPSIMDALGVPAIKRAVILITHTGASLEMEAFRNGVKMADGPRLLSRPDPYSTSWEFKRDTLYNYCTRGEFVWWIAKRDPDGRATALINVPLAELNVEANPRNRLRPVYTWGSVESTRWTPATTDGDFVHMTYMKEPGALRGLGPLQLCGAAISVSVEAQEWAANFYAGGGVPPIVLRTNPSIELSSDEATEAKAAWMNTPSNTPQVLDGDWEEPWESHSNPQGAQMLDSRAHQNGEAALIFDMPGSLLDFSTPGSSLTYQNVAEEYTKWVRSGLLPTYLEPFEQAMSDLLTNSTIAKFSVAALQRADAKTRMETYAIGIPLGVIPLEDAQAAEGVIPGSIETAPVPAAAPAATPSFLPTDVETRSAETHELRCNGSRMRVVAGQRTIVSCDKLLSPDGVFVGRCPRCKKVYEAEAVA
jgi:HK97 family phage portal protein